MKTPIKFIVIQSGYALFGAGATKSAAIADAALWMESPDNIQGGMSADEVAEFIANEPRQTDACFYIKTIDDPEFDDYLENQGGYEKINGEWFSV